MRDDEPTIWKFDELDSTNDLAKSLLQGAVSFSDWTTPCVVVAERQTKGRGRRERCWYSWDGALTFSVAAKWSDFNLTRRESPILSRRVADAVAETAREIAARFAASDVAARFVVKEPNDVYYAGKKFAGALIESPNSQDVVVGVGVNVFNRAQDAPSALQRPTISLADVLDATRVKSVDLRKDFLLLFWKKLFGRQLIDESRAES